MDLAIIPECYVDTNLIETLVPPVNRGYNHQKGCGRVAAVMKAEFADKFALGIIDKDKNQLDYLKEFALVHQYGNLSLYKHGDKPHYIIQINPAIERFLMSGADSVGISLTDHDLPADLGRLKKISKSVNSKQDPRFKQLIRSVSKAGAPEFLKLSQWIKYIRDTNYDLTLDELKAL